MKKEAIEHIPLSQYAFAEGSHTLTLRLRAAKGDLTEALLFYGDRVDPEDAIRMTSVSMERILSDSLFDYYEATLTGVFPRVCYYFLLSDGTTQCFYYPRGFAAELTCGRAEYFQFPYLRREDIPSIPVWASDVRMYHIFPHSFANGKREIISSGGTLNGIRENLDYLAARGINCLYLNPIFAADTVHRYDTRDYFKVDPRLGTEDDLTALVSDCHARGIRVILDGVFNHSGPNFPPFLDVRERGAESKYRDWFYEMPFPVRYTDPPKYAAFAYVKEMPKLNTGNPEVVSYFCEVGTYWIKNANIDGWRLDVANEVDHDFWRTFRKAVRSVKPDCLLIGEIWEDAGPFLFGDQFDSTMNYTFTYLCRDFFAERKIPVSEFDAQIARMILRYPKSIALAQMNFLDSHDIPRFLSFCEGDERRLSLALFYLYTGYGIPSVFYGDECLIQGREEVEYRAPMRWDRQPLAEYLTELNAMRREHPALCRGDYRTVFVSDETGVYAFLRTLPEETVVIALNNSDAIQNVTLPGLGTVTLGPMEGKLYKKDS